jgi:hypothetical protein
LNQVMKFRDGPVQRCPLHTPHFVESTLEKRSCEGKSYNLQLKIFN